MLSAHSTRVLQPDRASRWERLFAVGEHVRSANGHAHDLQATPQEAPSQEGC